MSLSKKSVKSLLALALVLVMVVAFLPAFTSGMNAQAAKDFGGKRVGCWWWSSSDINEPNATNYLQCMQDCGVNEIYLSCFNLMNTVNNRAKLHTFVAKAATYGCRVSVLYGEWDDFANNSAKNFDLLVGYLATYKSEYPTDALYGIHMDIEPGSYNATVLQEYADKFIARVQNARKGGTYIEVDVNCGWNGQGGTTTTLSGVTGIYNILAKNFDAVFAMSYRNTMSGSDTIATFAAPVISACKTAGTPVFLGVETDNVTPAKVTFYSKSKEYMFGVMDQAMTYLAGQGLADYGMAIHQNKSLYAMSDTTPTTTAPAGDNCIWQGDINMDITTKNTVGIIKVESLTEAIRNDIAAYGPASKYIVVSEGSSYTSGPSGYCVFGFYQDANATKGLEYLESWGKAEKGSELAYCTWETTKELSKMGTDVNFCVYSDDTGDICHIGSLKVYAFHDGTVITTKSTQQTVASTTTPTYTPVTQPTTQPSTQPTVASTTQKPVEIFYGDANDDCEVNMKDVLVMRKYLAGVSDHISLKTADANGDGEVNMKDVLLVRKYLAGIVSESDLGPKA